MDTSAIQVAVAALVVVLIALYRRKWPKRHKHERFTLPNGEEIYHISKAESELLYRELFDGQCYRLPQGHPDQDWMTIELAPHDTVVDVGANIGLFALWAKWHPSTKAKVRVLSFECVPSTFAVLEKNATLHSTAACRLESFPVGLSDAERSATVLHHVNFSIWSSGKAEMDEARGRMLQDNVAHLARRVAQREALPAPVRWVLSTAPMQALINWGGRRARSQLNETAEVAGRVRRLSDGGFGEAGVGEVALLKVDVEGAELDVLRGIDAVHWSRIKQVAMECEDAALTRKVTALLELHGFAVRSWVSEDMAELLPSSQVHQLLAKRTQVTASSPKHAKGPPEASRSHVRTSRSPPRTSRKAR